MADRKGRGTVEPAPNFNAEKVASRLRRAMRGIGTDEKVIIDILSTHNNVQRQLIKRKYKTMYGRVLSEDLKAELGGHFEDVCLALLTPLAEFVVDCLHIALKEIDYEVSEEGNSSLVYQKEAVVIHGNHFLNLVTRPREGASLMPLPYFDIFVGYRADENCIIEILVSLECMELRYIKQVFRDKYNHDLGEFLCSGLRGDIRKLVSALTSKDREYYAEVDEDLAIMEAHHLYDAGLSKSWGTDEDLFITVLATRSREQLRATIAAYERVAGHMMEEAIKAEFGGSIRHALLAIVECIDNQPAFYAKQLHAALNGPGTDDKTIIRILVSRSEVDLADIQEWFHMQYNEDLIEAIYADTCGDYRKILLKLLEP